MDQKQFTNFTRANIEHKHLLYNLKSTVETLFLNNKCSTINNATTSSSLSTLQLNQESLLRLHMSIEQIFNNGIRLFKQDVSLCKKKKVIQITCNV